MARLLKHNFAKLLIGGIVVFLATFLVSTPKTLAADPYLYGELGTSPSADKITAYIKAAVPNELKYLTGTFTSQNSYITLSSLKAHSSMPTSAITENLVSGKFTFDGDGLTPLSLNTNDIVWTATFDISNDTTIGTYGIEACPETARFSPDETQQYNDCAALQVSVDAAYQDMYFKNPRVEKTIGETEFTNPLIKTLVPGDVVYASTDEDVATVDQNTGKVTIRNTGNAEIVAIASAYGRFYETAARYSLIVSEPAPEPEPADSTTNEESTIAVPDTGHFTGSNSAISVASAIGAISIAITSVIILGKRTTKKKIRFDKK